MWPYRFTITVCSVTYCMLCLQLPRLTYLLTSFLFSPCRFVHPSAEVGLLCVRASEEKEGQPTRQKHHPHPRRFRLRDRRARVQEQASSESWVQESQSGPVLLREPDQSLYRILSYCVGSLWFQRRRNATSLRCSCR